MEIDNQNPPHQTGEDSTQHGNVHQQRNDDHMQYWIPTKNPPALISYYCGIFGLLPFIGLPFAIAAVVLGIIGLKKVKKNPTPGAKGHAITGLVFGLFELAVFVAFLIAVIYDN